MLCEECKKDKEPKEFILRQRNCYKCIYKKKIKACKEKKKICQECQKIIKFSFSKNKQRSKYCSEECARIAQKRQNDNYWTKKLRKSTSILTTAFN